MKKTKIIVLGRNGQVATNLYDLFLLENQNFHNFDVIFYSSKDLDLSKPNDVQKFLNDNIDECDYLINCTAYNYVDKAEEEKEICDNLNNKSISEVAKFCAKKEIKFIHFSTDYVFDGSGNLPFDEKNIKNLKPVNYYGKTKLDGENAIINSGCDYLIFRVSWVYDIRPQFKNFFNAIKNLAKTRDELKIVSDQIGSPTSAYFIASNTIRIIKHINSSKNPFPKGIYNLNNGRFISWYDFAIEIIDSLRRDEETLKVSSMVSIKSEEFKTTAKRPHNSRLCNKKIIEVFNLDLNELQKKYLTVFAHYDKDNIIDDYVLYYLKGLKEISKNIIFVSDCDLPENEVKKLDDLCFHVIAKKHGESNDFGSYKRGLFCAKELGILDNFDDLILANDSCYGPLSPFTPIFTCMEYRICDFWGMTQNKDNYPEHIQSYFVVFNKKILQNNKFFDFFNNIKKEASKTKIIKNYEIGLTQFLTREGYKKISFIEKIYNNNPTSSEELFLSLLPNGFPFLKIELIKANPMRVLDIRRWKNFVNNKLLHRLINNHSNRVGRYEELASDKLKIKNYRVGRYEESASDKFKIKYYLKKYFNYRSLLEFNKKNGVFRIKILRIRAFKIQKKVNAK